MSTNKKILIIENDTAWREHFKKIIEMIDGSCEVILLDIKEFSNSYQSSSDFDDVDFCLVDLELGAAADRRMHDKWGLEKVLPLIRKMAPWIPVACISRFISGDDDIIRELSLSDFDGFFPKSIIASDTQTSPDFNAQKWVDILHALSVKRVSSLIGRSVLETAELIASASDTNLAIAEPLKKIIDNDQEQIFKEGISLLGIGAKKYAIDALVAGFSGLSVAKLGAYGTEIKSYWLIKWGTSIRKLCEEAMAHRKIYSSGIKRRLIVPQLYSNVINWKGLGFIAYSFEENTVTALDDLRANGFRNFKTYMEVVFTELYVKRDMGPISPKEDLSKWCNLSPDEIYQIEPKLQNNLEVSLAIIQGDLHLRNVLVREGIPTVIDFARSATGPIAIDFAKLTADVCAFTDLLEVAPSLFQPTNLQATPFGEVFKIMQRYLVEKDDLYLFYIAMVGYFIKYVSYPDVDDSVKKKMSSVIEWFVINFK